jgi:hypothetical protein
MKRWITHLTIAAYLGVLTWGVVSHALGYKTGMHPGMYFIVWDMFCGWSAYEVRYHLVGFLGEQRFTGADRDLAVRFSATATFPRSERIAIPVSVTVDTSGPFTRHELSVGLTRLF